MSKKASASMQTSEMKEAKTSKRRKNLDNQNTLTSYFSNPMSKEESETKENIENNVSPSPILKKVKQTRKGSPRSANSSQKITMFLKNPKAPNENGSQSDVSSQLSNPPKRHSSLASSDSGTNSANRMGSSTSTKKTMLQYLKDSTKKYESYQPQIYTHLLAKINESLNFRFNAKKIERIFHTCMKQFLRSSPDQLWCNVYKPLSVNEVTRHPFSDLNSYCQKISLRL